MHLVARHLLQVGTALLIVSLLAIALFGTGQFREVLRAYALEPPAHWLQILLIPVVTLLLGRAVWDSAARMFRLRPSGSARLERAIAIGLALACPMLLAVAAVWAGTEVPATGSDYRMGLNALTAIGMVGAIGVCLGYIRALTTGSPRSRLDDGLEQSGRLTGYVAFAAAAVFLVLPLISAKWSNAAATAVGPVAIVSLALTVYAVVLTRIAVLSWRSGKPWLSGVLAVVVVFYLAGFNDNRLIQPMPTKRAPLLIEEAFWQWFDTRKEISKGGPIPVFIVATQGGGLYAARHSASTLARLQDECPAFAQHIFAISSVSGGSLGAAVFASAVREKLPDVTVRGCEPSGNTDFQNYVAGFLEADFLSPLLWTWLIPDVAQQLLPYPAIESYARARALETAFELREAAVGRSGLMEMPVLDYWSAKGALPALFVNTTRVGTGAQLYVSPISLRPAGVAEQDALLHYIPETDIRISTAVGLSARFPIVSPTARLKASRLNWRKERETFVLSLVDGGYAENSGLEGARQLYLRIGRLVDARTRTSADFAGYYGIARKVLSSREPGQALSPEWSREAAILMKAISEYRPPDALSKEVWQAARNVRQAIRSAMYGAAVAKSTQTADDLSAAIAADVEKLRSPPIILSIIGIAEGSILTAGFGAHQEGDSGTRPNDSIEKEDDSGKKEDLSLSERFKRTPQIEPNWRARSDADHFLAPLLALNASRTHRPDAAMRNLGETLSRLSFSGILRSATFTPITLTNSREDMPLAWFLSRLTHDRIGVLRAKVPESGGGRPQRDGESCLLAIDDEEERELTRFGDTIEATQDGSVLRCWLRDLRTQFSRVKHSSATTR